MKASSPLVVSLHPALDVEWQVRELVAEEKNEVLAERRWPGGKGINVARWLRWLGADPELFLPLGGSTGGEIEAGLRGWKLRYERFPVALPTRANIVVTTDRRSQYRLNPVWRRLTAREAAGLRRRAAELASRAGCTVLSGAVPGELPRDTYARILQASRGNPGRRVLDCDGEPFRLAAPEGPFLVKPNVHELAAWAGTSLRSAGAQLRAARRLASVTGGWVLVSRGGQGAFLVGHGMSEVWSARGSLSGPVRNTVGAGDALLAGAVSALVAGAEPVEWLRRGVATGSVAVAAEPGQPPRRQALQAALSGVEVERLPSPSRLGRG